MRRTTWMTWRALALTFTGAFVAACGGAGEGDVNALDLVVSTVQVDRTGDVRADGLDPVQVDVRLRRKDGKPAQGFLVTVSVNGTGNVLSPAPASGTDGDTRATLTSTVAETKVISVTVRGAEGGGEVKLGAQPTVTFVAGPAVRLTYRVPPSTVQAGQPFFPAIELAAVDGKGNVARSASGTVTLSLGNNPPGALLGGGASAALEDGAVAFHGLVVDRPGQGFTLVATAEGLESATSDAFNVESGPPTRLAFVADVPDATAGDVLTPGVRVELQDEGGQRITNIPAQVTLSLASGTGTLLGTRVQPLENGEARFDDLSIAQAGQFRLLATASGYTSATSSTFVIHPGSPSLSTSSVTATPDVQVADGTSPVLLKATVRDAHGNLLADVPVTFDATGGGVTYSPSPQGTSNVAGEVQVSLTSTVAEGKDVVALIDGAQTAPVRVTFTAGPPAFMTTTLTATPPQATADGTPVTLQVQVRDALGNPVAGEEVILIVSGSQNELDPDPPLTVSDAAGVATFTLATTKAEVKTVEATVGAFIKTLPVLFSPGPPVQAESSLVLTQDPVTADGADATVAQVTLRDAFGNAVFGHPVTVSVSGTGNILQPGGGTVTTDANGEGLVTIRSTVAEAKTVTASATVAGFSLTAPVLFVPGPPDPANSFAGGNPNGVVGTQSILFEANFRDAHMNAIGGQPVTLSSSEPSDMFAAGTALTSSAIGRVSTTVSATVSGIRTLSATLGGVTVSNSFYFVNGPASTVTSTIDISPASLPADGVSVATVTVALRDEFGNPVTVTSVSLTATGSGHTFTPSYGPVNANGVFTAQLRSTVAQTKTVTATQSAGIALTAQVTFTGVPPIRYGNTTPFTQDSSHASNYLLGSPLNIPTARTLTHLAVIGRSSGSLVKLALYTDVGGNPGTLVAQTAPVALQATTMEIPVTAQASVPAGNYWIVGIYNTSAAIGIDYADSGAVVKYISLPFNSALPSSFGAHQTYTGQRFNYYVVMQ